MERIKRIFKNLSKIQKISCLIAILIFFFFALMAFPSLAKLRNRNTILTQTVWDGTIANSYRKGTGTQADPYIISNGSELAYFSNQLKNNDYENIYFELGNDIILNDGILSYDQTKKITYTKDNNEYFVDENTNQYYNNSDRTGVSLGKINNFQSLKNFKGNFNGNEFIIYGLYINDKDSTEVSLFPSLSGNISNLYVENSIIYGGNKTAGISSNSNNSTIKNVLYSGSVIAKDQNNTYENNTGNKEFLFSTDNTNGIIDIPNINLDGSIVSASISGSYTISDPSQISSIKINGIEVQNNAFDIELGNNILSTVNIIVTTTSENVSVNFTNLKYKVIYKNNITSGIVADATDVDISNVINKGTTFSNYISGGIVGLCNSNVKINQSYNVGTINSLNISGGIIGLSKSINDTSIINKVYNDGNVFGEIDGGIIGLSKDSILNISNTFNTINNYAINTSTNSVITLSNSYTINNLSIKNGTLTNNFTETTLNNLKSKTFLIDTLKYNEFVSYQDLNSNDSNSWLYESDEFPILYLDNIKNPIANINISNYSWNNFTTELNTIKSHSKVTFSLNNASETSNVKQKYYYISNSKNSLTKDQLNSISNWQIYSDIVDINTSGYCVIYAKIIDNNNNITYINSDILAIDLSGYITKININQNEWSKYNSNLSNVYVNDLTEAYITATDDLVSISSINYYLSQNQLTKSELDSISNWINYTSPVQLNNFDRIILYVKIIDSDGVITYLNTDYITYSGYHEEISVGQNSIDYGNNNITSNSSITFKFSNNTSLLFQTGYTHNIITNTLLPKGTKIILLDKNKKKIYKYKIDTVDDLFNYNGSCSTQNCIKYATYTFSLFKEIGTATEEKLFEESSYYNEILSNENYNIILDFKDTEIINNIDNVKIWMEIEDANNNKIIQTMSNEVETFNIYSTINNESSNANLYLTTDFNGTIAYNSNSTTLVNLNGGINYKNIESKLIADTTYENEKLGLAINILDSNGNVVSKEKYKNMYFKIDNNEYHAESDNTFRINLNNGIQSLSKPITIITKENDDSLKDGTYYIKIYLYSSYDGYYSDNLNTYIQLPLQVINNINNFNYTFDVLMNNSPNIINSLFQSQNIEFNIVTGGDLIDPKIRLALYEKKEFSAYNQDYNLVDLKNYVTNTFLNSNNFHYQIGNSTMTYQLNLLPGNLNKNGYKYVFELYDGNTKVRTIEKKFIVK